MARNVNKERQTRFLRREDDIQRVRKIVSRADEDLSLGAEPKRERLFPAHLAN
jgi:hypothetical protein